MQALIATGLTRHIQPVFNCGGTATDAADRRCCMQPLITRPVAVQLLPVQLMLVLVLVLLSW